MVCIWCRSVGDVQEPLRAPDPPGEREHLPNQLPGTDIININPTLVTLFTLFTQVSGSVEVLEEVEISGREAIFRPAVIVYILCTF